jgi:hypothetical protein
LCCPPTDPVVLPIENRFFGGCVTVTGLLTATDIVEQAKTAVEAGRISPNATLFIPDIIFNADGLTLDGFTVADLKQALGCRKLARGKRDCDKPACTKQALSQGLHVIPCTVESLREALAAPQG